MSASATHGVSMQLDRAERASGCPISAPDLVVGLDADNEK
jgi:hypothetical protein